MFVCFKTFPPPGKQYQTGAFGYYRSSTHRALGKIEVTHRVPSEVFALWILLFSFNLGVHDFGEHSPRCPKYPQMYETDS